jgi:hypothetical protein
MLESAQQHLGMGGFGQLAYSFMIFIQPTNPYLSIYLYHRIDYCHAFKEMQRFDYTVKARLFLSANLSCCVTADQTFSRHTLWGGPNFYGFIFYDNFRIKGKLSSFFSV